MGQLVAVQNVAKAYGENELFEGLSLGIQEGEKVALIGTNGSGKSTLLKMLAGLEQPDDGEVIRSRDLRPAFVAQLPTFEPGHTVFDAMQAEAERLSIPQEDQFSVIPPLIGKVGFTRDDTQVDSLSGGWRRRLSVARALLADPNLMLLDEPTNHMDWEAVFWLESFLRDTRIAFILISHDRELIDRSVRRVIEINPVYPDGHFSVSGNYREFLEKREDFLAMDQRSGESLATKVRKEIDWLRRSPAARTSKSLARIEQAESMIARLESMQRRRQQASQRIGLAFAGTERQTRKLIELHSVSAGYDDNTLFSKLSMTLGPGSRLGILGLNGSGKSTLLKILAGERQAESGTRKTADALRIAYFDQERTGLDDDATLQDALTDGADSVVFRGQSVHVAGYAQRFLFQPHQLGQRVSRLSGGERARLVMARFMLQEADVLLLDEPTNDLDIDTLEVLEDSLNEFPGAVVLVSHDRAFIDRVCREILAILPDGSHGLFADRSQWERAARAKVTGESATSGKSTTKGKAKPAKVKKLTYAEEIELKKMEATILKAEAAVESAQEALEDPSLASDHVALAIAAEDLESAQQQVEQLYARWEELETKQSG